jgi:Rab GTPase-activating protein 1
VLLDATTMVDIFSFEVQRILFYAHGIADSSEAACFAFTWSHGDSQESAIFQCHVFRCDIPEAVSSDLKTHSYLRDEKSLSALQVRQVSTCFAKAFMRTPPKPQPSIMCEDAQSEFKSSTLQSPVSTLSELFTFELAMELKEGDSKVCNKTLNFS